MYPKQDQMFEALTRITFTGPRYGLRLLASFRARLPWMRTYEGLV